MKKYIILTICLIVSYYGNCQNDTIINIPASKLVQIGKDLYKCEVSNRHCLEREAMYIEMIYNDSVIMVQNDVNLAKSVKENQNLLQANKNLEKSNNLLKLSTISGFALLLLSLVF